MLKSISEGNLYLPMHRYSVHIFSCSDPSGILGFDREQITAYAGARGVRSVVLSVSSPEQTQCLLFSNIVDSLSISEVSVFLE